MLFALRGTLEVPAARSQSYSHLSYSIYQPGWANHWVGYSAGGVRSVPIESETHGYPIVGIPYIALFTLGFGSDLRKWRRPELHMRFPMDIWRGAYLDFSDIRGHFRGRIDKIYRKSPPTA